MRIKWFTTIQKAVFLACLSVAGLRAEATKEIYGDAGLYAVPPSVYTNLQIFGGSAGTTNLNKTGVAGTPEGKQVIEQTVPANQASFWGIINTNVPGSQTIAAKNYSDYLGGSIRFWLKSTSSIQVKVQYSGVTPDPSVTIPSTGDTWQEQVIPLSSLGATAVRLGVVRIPFIFVDNGTLSDHVVHMDHIRWTKPVSSLIISPTTVQVNQGKSREFTVEGRDAANELVIVYPQFSSSLGTLTPASGKAQAVILNVTSASDGQITATTDGKNAAANIDVTAASLVAQFNVLSETFSGGVQLGNDNPLKNSELFLFSENNADVNTLPVMSNFTGGSPEGSQYSKVVFRQKTLTTQFQGVAIQWGVGNNPTTPTIDMSNYYNGSLRFWFKGPSSSTQLRDKLTIAMRSGNVEAGKEVSSVLLKDYATFNDQWQAVTIPISVFAQARPFADLSRMKVLFTMSVAGQLSTATESLRTISIDKVRWDTETPGALASIQITAASPANTMPVGVVNQFSANGLDAAGKSVDVFPTWNFASTVLGTFVQSQGPSVFLRAVNSPASGTLRAQQGLIVGTLAGAVVNASYPGVWNIATDAGVGGELQVFTGLEGSETGALVEGVTSGGAPNDTNDYLVTTYALDNLNPPANDSFAAWGVVTGQLPLQHFNTGFLRFFVRTPRDLEISIASADVNPDNNHAKVLLSELGVPFGPVAGGTWQQVIVPLSVFKQREPLLDLSELTTLFVIGSNSGLAGEISDQFDVDRVEYLSTTALPNIPPSVNVGPDQILTMGTTVGNGQVDGNDFLIWQRNFGNTPASPTWYAPADINGNGAVDAADYTVWRDHYGANSGIPGSDVADIDPPTALTQFNSSVSDDGKPIPPATLTLTWSVINGDANQVVFSDVSDPFATVYFKALGIYGLKLNAFDGQFNSFDTVSIEVIQGGAAAVAALVATVENDFTITTPAKSEVRVTTDDQGLVQVQTVGTDVSSQFARLAITYQNDKIDYTHHVTPASAQAGGADQTGFVHRQDSAGFGRETELLARAFEIVMPYASNDQAAVINRIMNDLGVNLAARPSPAISDNAGVQKASRGTFFRPARGEQGKIEFTIPTESFVSIVIYDRFGQQVRALVNASMAASANHVELWDGKDDNGSFVSPGTYLVDCQIGGEKIKLKAVVSN